MSHAVEPSQLAEVAAPYGTAPYLLYSSERGEARVNHVRVQLITESPVLVITGFGRGVARALDREAPLSLLWPNPGTEQFSLIADGTGVLGDEGKMEFRVTSAVMHRPAPEGKGSATC